MFLVWAHVVGAGDSWDAAIPRDYRSSSQLLVRTYSVQGQEPSRACLRAGALLRGATPQGRLPSAGRPAKDNLALLQLSVKKSLSRPTQLPRGDDASAFKGEGAAGPERRQACPHVQTPELRSSKLKVSPQGHTARERDRARTDIRGRGPPGCAPSPSARSEPRGAAARPSGGSWLQPAGRSGRGGCPPPPATAAAPPHSHRFFPAGPGLLPSQECAPGMSILISPAL